MEAIAAYDLGKRYSDGVWGIKDVTFTAYRGEVTVLLGPNGAGKTTTVKVLTTILRPTKGSAYVLGMHIVRDASEVRSKVTLCPQDIRGRY